MRHDSTGIADVTGGPRRAPVLRAGARLLLGLVIAVAAAGCGVGPSGTPGPTDPVPPLPPSGAPTVPLGDGLVTSVPATGGVTTPTSPATATPSGSSAPSTTAPTGPASDFAAFSSPSGNIGCVVTPESARCDIARRTFNVPPSPPSCSLDWGQGVWVDASGPGGFVCAGDTALGADQTLAYGSRIEVEPFTCSSATTGMTCINGTTGHGFTLAQATVRLF